MNVLCVMTNSSFASLQKEGTTQRTVLRSLHISIVRRSGDRGAIMPVPLPKDEGGCREGDGGGGGERCEEGRKSNTEAKETAGKRSEG